MTLQLRPYQLEALEGIDRELAQHPSTLLVHPTGTGKTVVMEEYLRRRRAQAPEARFLYLAHTRHLIEQTAARFRAGLGVHVEIELGAQKATGRAPVTCASIQSVVSRLKEARFRPGTYDTVFIDECFPAGTLVGGRAIETIKAGDMVPSYSSRFGHTRARVVAAWSSVPSALVRVTAGGRSVVCTPNHPFAVQERGCLSDVVWTHAGELRPGSRVLWYGKSRLSHSLVVESVETIPETADGTWGGACPDGRVYNMEVEDTHTYLVGSSARNGGFVVHNCHHSEAITYQRVVTHLAARRLIGVTATPDRLDQRALSGTFKSVAHRYDIQEAIQDGYLVPIQEREVIVQDLTFEGLRMNRRTGDFDDGELEARMRQAKVLQQVAGPLLAESGDRPTIVFTAGIDHAHDLAALLAAAKGPERVRAVSGETPLDELKAILKAYDRGEVQYLLNAQLLTEGLDAPPTSCVAMCRATRSRARYVQALGRGLRLHPGKQDCLVLNFVPRDGISLIGPVDVLGGVEIDPEVRARAIELTRRGLDSSQALSKATREIALAKAKEAERKAELKARNEAARRQNHASYREFLARHGREFGYTVVETDPFSGAPVTTKSKTVQQAGAFAAPGVKPPPVEARTLEETPADRDELAQIVAQYGIPAADYNQYELLEWISWIGDRRRRKLCTYKMARVLLQHRLNPDMSFEGAQRVLNALSQAGWRVTDAVRQAAQYA